MLTQSTGRPNQARSSSASHTTAPIVSQGGRLLLLYVSRLDAPGPDQRTAFGIGTRRPSPLSRLTLNKASSRRSKEPSGITAAFAEGAALRRSPSRSSLADRDQHFTPSRLV
jgi:hypothetical protein